MKIHAEKQKWGALLEKKRAWNFEEVKFRSRMWRPKSTSRVDSKCDTSKFSAVGL